MGIPCVDGCLQSLAQDAYGFVKKRWLILYHFKKNFADLKEKKEELEEQRGIVQEQVERAKYKGEEIKKQVLEWMDDKEIKEFNDLMHRKTERQSITCFNFSFPNCISRYQLSKRAEKEITALLKKMDDGKKFTAVSNQGRTPKELQFPPEIEEYKVFESREVVLKEIKDASKEFNVVGIHGTGGVGKTTMAAEVAKQLLNEDRIDEFVMAVVSRDPDVKRIQGKLASSLQIQLDENESEQKRATKLWNRLDNGKRNLVILDDVWDKINLRAIGIPVLVGNNECKLLITSRLPQEVWKDTTWDSKLLVKQIRVNELDRKEAWALFKNHAGDSVESSDVHSISMEVCEKCGGLPVAIRAVGIALRDKERYVWEDALDKIKNHEMERIADIDVKIFGSLKLSYEMLSDKEAQRCFLLCCLFPDDFEIPIEELVLHCLAAGFVDTLTMEKTRRRVHTLIDLLKSRCLLLDVPVEWYDDGVKVKVHDVIRDVGIAISKKGNESLQLMHDFRGGEEEDEGAPSSSSSQGKNKWKPYIAMWLRKSHFQDDHSFPGDVGTLFLQWYDSSVKDYSSFVSKKKKEFEEDQTLLLRANKLLCGKILSLKVLVLSGLNISSVFPPSSSGGESLANLRMLWVNTWKADDAAVLRHLQKLKVFRLTDYFTDHDVVELPAEIRLLTELLVLDLKGLEELRKIPSGVLSKLTRLEELHLPLEFTGWENGENENGRSENASISELGCLKRLTALSAFFPNCDLPWANDIFGKLNRFDIKVGSAIRDPSIVSTKALTLGGVSITNKFNGLICKADVLSFDTVNGLSEAIHGTSRGFPYLKKLVIEGCHDLNYVFTEPCARALPQLRELDVEDCESLLSIVGGIEEEISEQDQGGDIIYFPRLEELRLTDLPNWVKNRTSAAANGATYIRGKIHGFPCLEILEISGCHDLNYVFTEPCARALPQLRILEVEKCESLVSILGGIEEEISEQDQGGDIIYFPRLEKLFVSDLPNLVGFHSGVKNRTSGAADGATSVFFSGKIVYPALKMFTFESMPKATEVFKSRILPQLTGQDSKEICQHENDFQGVSLPTLTVLRIYDHENIEMPEEISFTPAEHGITVCVNRRVKEGVDKRMFQPLFDAVLGIGCE